MLSNRRRLMIKTAAATAVLLALAGAAGGYAFLKSGLYHVGSIDQHFQITHTLLEQGMRKSVQLRTRSIVAPADLAAPARVQRGAGIYQANCVQCHGAPGVAQQDFGRSMQPVPGPLVDATKHWGAAQLYWITRNGIKMSGMPAWEFHLSEAQLWDVVAFMAHMPALDVAGYAAIVASAPLPASNDMARTVSAVRGRTALTQYACNACHMIPGVTGSEVYVGRPLHDLAKRKYIAGHLPNTRANLIKWIRNPQSVDPQTTMPMLRVSEADAIDMSEYLLTQ